MASNVTVLRRPVEHGASVLDRVKAQMLALQPRDGHTTTTGPDLCFYRFSQPTTFHKSATFGVTLGVVLQGEKRMRVGRHELTVDPARLLVVTRETEHVSAVSRRRPNSRFSV